MQIPTSSSFQLINVRTVRFPHFDFKTYITLMLGKFFGNNHSFIHSCNGCCSFISPFHWWLFLPRNEWNGWKKEGRKETLNLDIFPPRAISRNRNKAKRGLKGGKIYQMAHCSVHARAYNKFIDCKQCENIVTRSFGNALMYGIG